MRHRLWRVLALIVLFLLTGWWSRSAAASPSPQPAGKTDPLPPSSFPENRSLRAENDTSFLTGPQAGDPLTIALDYLQAHQAELGLAANDTAGLVVTDQYTSEHTGTTHIYLRQQWQGLPVVSTVTSINVAADGSIINLYTNFVSNLGTRVVTQVADLTAEEAVHAAARAVGLVVSEPLTVQEQIGGVAQELVFSTGGISLEPIPARLVYQPIVGGAVRLAWAVEIYELSSQHWWNIRVDAVTGEALAQNDYVVSENWGESGHAAASQPTTLTSTTSQGAAASQSPLAPDSYRVYAMPIVSPIYTTPAPPADARTVVTNPANALASPYGWHDINGAAGAEYTTTQGNNAHAYTDTDASNTPDAGSSPDGGASLDFNFALDLTQAPSTYRPAAVTNLFYWNNIIHDVYYQYGFTEAAGNFQENNYGRGGTASDYVYAEAQDGSGTNNANFATPSDGNNPRMQMYIGVNPNPDVDGDLDNHVIVHEYGHGISNRLTGGPSNVSCLGNQEQMGEGWSDWLGLVVTTNASETATTNRPVGNYLFGYATTHPGIRPAPYTTDMAVNGYTYANRADANISIPHGVGFIWSTMLWDMYWNLVDEYGFNSNFYGAWNTGGNNLAIQLVMDGMKLQPCSPGFVDGRNAILQADTALTGGRNQCHIWAAFARRGLGFSASQGSSTSRTDGTAAFDMPTACQLLNAPTFPASQSICSTTTNSVTYDVLVGSGFTTPVTLSASGNPVGSTTSFAPNPVTVIPRYSTLTVNNLLGAATGNYTITVNGTGVATDSTTVALNVVSAIPGATTLATPANGSLGVGLLPTLTWNAAANGASYLLELDDDPSFGSINYSTTVVGTSHTLTTSLANGTAYYWRVRPQNGCGLAVYTPTFSFITAFGGATTTTCNQTDFAIPDNTPAGVNSNITNPGTETLVDLDVVITTTHSWVGDLIFTLTHVDTGSVVTVIDRPGNPATTNGCANNHINTRLSDEAAASVETQCATSTAATPPPYAINGTFIPNNPLSAFDGQSLSGTWQLNASDRAGGDTGTLTGWCLVATIPLPPSTADYSDLANSYGVAWHTGTGALRLGSNWTADTSYLLAGDDASDDGITRLDEWVPGNPATLGVTVGGSGAAPWLAGWVDWNNNGVFETPGERIVDQAVTVGNNAVVFSVPLSYTTGATVQARFRLYDSQPFAPTSNAAATGAAANGEVEDFSYAFSPTAISLQSFQAGANWVWPLAVSVVGLVAAATLFWFTRRRSSKQ